MAVTFKNYNSAAGITYKYITDTQADWGDVPGGNYFFDLETNLPYYRDSQGYVIEVFATGQSAGNVTTFANIDKQLISGGAQWNTGMTFDVSTLTYSFDGTIQTTDGPSTVTLSVGDPSFDRIDAIVVSDDSPYGIVSVIEGQPASNPGTPEIPFDKLLVQLIIVSAGVTSISVNEDIIYDENEEWTGSIVDVSGIGTLNFDSTIPTPQEGTKCLRVTGNNRRKWARFTRTSLLTTSDYTSISGYFYAEEYAPKRRLYIRFRSGTSYVGNGVYVTNTFASTSTPGIWQQFTVPLYLFNLPGAIDGVDIQYMSSVNTTINNWALDFVRLQGGFNPAQITSNNSNIYNSNGSLTANRIVDQLGFDLLFKGDQNSKITQRITSTSNPLDSSFSELGAGYTNFQHIDNTNLFQFDSVFAPGNSNMGVSNLGTNASSGVNFNAESSSLSHYDGITTTREIKVDEDGVSVNQQYTFPNADGSPGQIMSTNGSGTLGFRSLNDSDVYLYAEGSLTVNQLRALPTAPFTLLNRVAISTNQYYDVQKVILEFVPGTTPYNFTGKVLRIIGSNDATDFAHGEGSGSFGQTASTKLFITNLSERNSSTNMFPTEPYTSVAMGMDGVDATQGDGILSYKIWYNIRTIGI